MKARFQILAIICLTAQTALGDSPPRGKERLRELAVFPSITLQSGYEYKSGWNGVWLGNEVSLPADLKEIREQLKEKPNDIDLKLQLRFLLEHNHQTNEARACNLEAEQQCRKRLETRPNDGWEMVQLSEALENLDKVSEAESFLRKSVVVSSNDWCCWAHLGIHLAGRAAKLLFPSADRNGNAQSNLDIEALTNFQAPPEAMKQSEELQSEAERCMDKAQALGKNESLFWEKRAEYSSIVAWGNVIQKRRREESVVFVGAHYLAALSKSYLDDLRKASSLRPDDAKLIFLTGYMEWMAAIAESRASGKTVVDGTYTLTDAARKSIREAASRLESLYPKLGKTREAAALEFHAFLSAVSNEDAENGVIADVRRAVALDPTREQSWDMLIGLSSKSASPDEIEKLCESRLKTNTSARNHLIFAKLLTKEKKWARAKEQTEAALKLEPENLIGKIMLVALAIRQEPGEKLTEAVHPQFEAVHKLLSQMPEGDDRNARMCEAMSNLAISLVLADEPDGKAQASTLLENILSNVPDYQPAKDIRSALE